MSIAKTFATAALAFGAGVVGTLLVLRSGDPAPTLATTVDAPQREPDQRALQPAIGEASPGHAAIRREVVVDEAAREELARLKKEHERLQAYTDSLEDQLKVEPGKRIAARMARNLGITDDEMLMHLDRSALVPNYEKLAEAAQVATLDNIWEALRLERVFISDLSKIANAGPKWDPDGPDNSKERGIYRQSAVVPFVDRNLEPLCARFRRLGIPDLLVEHFREVRLEGR